MARKKTEQMRHHIVDAAARLFSQKHFHDVLMDEVAQAAKVSKGTLYRYFSDKHALYLAVHFHAADLWLEELGVIAEMDASPSEKLRSLVVKGRRFATEHKSLHALMSRGNPCRYKEGEERWRKRMGAFNEIMNRIVDEGVSGGEFRDVHRDILASLVRHSLFADGRRYGVRQEDVAAGFADLLLDGLRKS